MLRLLIGGLACGLSLLASSAQAQHAGDIEFHYENGEITILNGEEGFQDGKKIFEAEMLYLPGDSFDGYTDDPGFISEDPLGIGALDMISLNILESRFGYFLNYWNPSTGTVESTLANLDLDGFLSSFTTVSSLMGGSVIVGPADSSGEYHRHLDFFLTPGSDAGAYAVLVDMQTNAAGIGNSDPFYIVFGYGIDEVQHQAAVAHFAGVPEPGSIGLLACGTLFGLARFRRQRTSVS